ncbi:zinc knuckle-domain-containing protein [Thelephora terrestris]|uniref:Zinc knuckle-domain-containing protein n=1 Tax=Thelephora terrestris TaxID=56493 RepID=A0A9P6L5H7_9AGAM|nr:zinc knuckle-domain-containing protein [Thelephora terrestris]
MSKYAPHRRSGNNPRPTSNTVCQKCLGTGHFIYECKSTRPYVSRPSRTEQLAKVSTLDKAKLIGKPSVELPDEFKTQCVSKTSAVSSCSHRPHHHQERDGQQVTRGKGERTCQGQTRRIIYEREVGKEAEEVRLT